MVTDGQVRWWQLPPLTKLRVAHRRMVWVTDVHSLDLVVLNTSVIRSRKFTMMPHRKKIHQQNPQTSFSPSSFETQQVKKIWCLFRQHHKLSRWIFLFFSAHWTTKVDQYSCFYFEIQSKKILSVCQWQVPGENQNCGTNLSGPLLHFLLNINMIAVSWEAASCFYHVFSFLFCFLTGN